jgi:hypothetical protein
MEHEVGSPQWIAADNFALAAVGLTASLEGEAAHAWRESIRQAALNGDLDGVDWQALLRGDRPLWPDSHHVAYRGSTGVRTGRAFPASPARLTHGFKPLPCRRAVGIGPARTRTPLLIPLSTLPWQHR